MSVAERIETLLRTAMQVKHLQLENESHMHAGPASESHFKLIMVSADFEGVAKVRRHQQVYALLSELMQNPIHALALHLYTPQEWDTASQQAPASPNCMGGSKK